MVLTHFSVRPGSGIGAKGASGGGSEDGAPHGADQGARAVADIQAQTGFDYSADWERQRQTQHWLQGEFPQYSFIDDMWRAYRSKY
jgi:hypothetical protein